MQGSGRVTRTPRLEIKLDLEQRVDRPPAPRTRVAQLFFPQVALQRSHGLGARCHRPQLGAAASATAGIVPKFYGDHDEALERYRYHYPSRFGRHVRLPPERIERARAAAPRS